MRLFICIGLLFCNSGIVFAGFHCSEYSGLDELECEYGQPQPETQMPWETNYWECILDEMPGAKTKTVAFAVRNKCNQYSRNYKIEKKSSFFGIKNASECVIEYASDTPSETAAKAISLNITTSFQVFNNVCFNTFICLYFPTKVFK